MFKQWTKKHTLLIAIVVVFALLLYVLLYFQTIRPLGSEAKALKQEITTYEKHIEKVKKEANSEVDQGLEAIGLKIPIKKSADQVLLNLQTLAKETGANITYIATADEGDTDGFFAEEEADESEADAFEKTSYEIRVEADKRSKVDAFMESLLDSERLFTIENIELTQSGAAAEATLIIAAYHVNQNNE